MFPVWCMMCVGGKSWCFESDVYLATYVSYNNGDDETDSYSWRGNRRTESAGEGESKV